MSRTNPNIAVGNIVQLTSAQQAASSIQTYTRPTPGKTPCANCRKRPGTLWWGDTLAVTHGFQQLWCEVCTLKAKIAHAEECAAKLPTLRARLAELEGEEAGDAE